MQAGGEQGALGAWVWLVAFFPSSITCPAPPTSPVIVFSASSTCGTCSQFPSFYAFVVMLGSQELSFKKISHSKSFPQKVYLPAPNSPLPPAPLASEQLLRAGEGGGLGRPCRRQSMNPARVFLYCWSKFTRKVFALLQIIGIRPRSIPSFAIFLNEIMELFWYFIRHYYVKK